MKNRVVNHARRKLHHVVKNDQVRAEGEFQSFLARAGKFSLSHLNTPAVYDGVGEEALFLLNGTRVYIM